MKKTLFLTALTLCIANFSFAQNNQIDSLTFSTENGLLVFEGYLNDVKINFAFDTGASLGVLNSKNILDAKIKTAGRMKVKDSQKNYAKISKAKIESLKIGSQNFSNISSVVTDMPFLYCNDLYLLGGDVINQLNWKFDFQKNKVYFSKTPFEPQNNMTEMPFKTKGNRHYSSLVIEGITIADVLVDFGYTGNYTMDAGLSNTQQIIDKQTADNLYKSKGFSMGVNSVSTGKETNVFYVDSILWGGIPFNNFKITSMPITDNKIGMYFIKKNFDQLILNNTQLKYWLLPNQITPQKVTNFDAGFYFNDNSKIEVVSLNNETNSTANSLRIGQEIKTINGRLANTFADRCEFLSWYSEQSKLQELLIEQSNGELLTIKKSIF